MCPPGEEVASATAVHKLKAALSDISLLAGAAISVKPDTMFEAEPTASSKAIAVAALGPRSQAVASNEACSPDL